MPFKRFFVLLTYCHTIRQSPPLSASMMRDMFIVLKSLKTSCSIRFFLMESGFLFGLNDEEFFFYSSPKLIIRLILYGPSPSLSTSNLILSSLRSIENTLRLNYFSESLHLITASFTLL